MKKEINTPSAAEKPAHTPGPWRSVPSTAGGGVARLDVVSDGAEFSPAFVAGDILPDDARLIAAAPELLAALKDVMSDPYFAKAATRYTHARAAIEKAEGVAPENPGNYGTPLKSEIAAFAQCAEMQGHGGIADSAWSVLRALGDSIGREEAVEELSKLRVRLDRLVAESDAAR
jgi:hypothetical protein